MVFDHGATAMFLIEVKESPGSGCIVLVKRAGPGRPGLEKHTAGDADRFTRK
jgi:hypothetical protein